MTMLRYIMEGHKKHIFLNSFIIDEEMERPTEYFVLKIFFIWLKWSRDGRQGT